MSHVPASGEADHAHAHEGHEEHHNSFMPLFLTIGTILLLLGAVRQGVVADGAPFSLTWLAIPGFLIIAASVWGWVREDVRELRGKAFATGHSEYLMGTIVLILSEIVLFGILFTFYFWSKARQGEAFEPTVFQELSLTPIIVNTVILLSSGATVHMAQINLKKGNLRPFQVWLGLTILLGAAFIGGQVYEYNHLIHEGLTPASGVFGTAFYSLTGVHGLHVVAGIVALTVIFGLSFTGFITKERASGVEGAFIYWHFVDAIWILVFSFVYLRVI